MGGIVAIRRMTTEELSRVSEVDVSESGSIVYECVDGDIRVTSEEWHRPRRNADEWKSYIEKWTDVLERGGAAVGAFDGNVLVGIAVLRYRLTESMAQLAALFVSREYRRQGIGTRLTQRLIRLAKEEGGRELYVSATPSKSAVGFYTSRGFRLAEQVNKELYELEPEDIHMIRAL